MQRIPNYEKKYYARVKRIACLEAKIWFYKKRGAEYREKIKYWKNIYNKFLKNYRAVDRFFKKPFYWRLGGGQNTLATEIVERIATGYDKLLSEKKIDSMLLTMYCTGYNQESFTCRDVEEKRGIIRQRNVENKIFNRRIVKMTNAGHLSSFSQASYRGSVYCNYYYLTPQGREYWEGLIKTMFLTQVKRPWRDIIDAIIPFEEKRTVRIYRKGKFKTDEHK